MKKFSILGVALVLSFIAVVWAITPAFSETLPDAPTITLENGKFSPEILEISADKKTKIIIKNMNKSAAEFESHDLIVRKLLNPAKKSLFL